MANVWGTVKDAGVWVTMESLEILESKRAVSQFFDTSYSKQFKLEYPVGDSIKIPFPMEYGIRNGLEYDPPTAQKRYATIAIGEPFGVDLPEIDSIEAALSSPRSKSAFSKQYLEPAMAQLAQEIDSRCALFAYQNAGGVLGVLGTDPDTLDATTGAARQKLQELGAYAGERGMLVPPVVMRTIRAANASLFNPVSDITKMFRDGIISHTDGFDWYEPMSLYQHTAGTWQAAVTVTTAPASGATTLAVTCTSGDIFKKGDKFSIASVYPVHPRTKRRFNSIAKTFAIVSDDVTTSSTSATLTLSEPIYGPDSPFQNVDALPIAGAALTLWPGTTSPNAKVGMIGLAIPKNAFALVGLDLEEFDDVSICKTQRDPDSGVSIRFMAAGDARSSKKIRRFDCCIGFGNLYPGLAHAVACGSPTA